jgi:hypothetical protein
VSGVRLGGGVKRESIRTIRFTPRFNTSSPTDFQNSAGSDSSPSIIVLQWEKKKAGVGSGFHVSFVVQPLMSSSALLSARPNGLDRWKSLESSWRPSKNRGN